MIFSYSVFFFNDTAPLYIYTYVHTLSPHDALPISDRLTRLRCRALVLAIVDAVTVVIELIASRRRRRRSDEHTSELQSLMRNSYAVFCLKKKNKQERSAYTYSHRTDIILNVKQQRNELLEN